MGFFSDLFGGPDEVTTTQTNEVQIPGFLRPFIEQSADVAGGALGGLSGLVNQGNLVAPFAEDQLAAFDLARQLALGGGPLATATQQLQDTASGAGFESDAFNNAFNALVRRQQPGIISPFIAAGRGTGGLAETALGQAQADAFASLFNQERQRQLGAARALPGIASAPFGLLSQIGTQQQQQAQQEISAPIRAQQSLLGSALGGLPVGGLLGRKQTATQPVFDNSAGTALGLGLTGLGLLTSPVSGSSLLGRLFG